MKVILLRDVAKIGKRHSITEVPDGYAQNQLIPKGLAKPATPENLKNISNFHKQAENKEKATEELFFATKKKLEEVVIKISGLKNDNGHLFAALKPEIIIEAAQKQDIDIDPKMLKIQDQIKTTGEHQVELIYGKNKGIILISIE